MPSSSPPGTKDLFATLTANLGNSKGKRPTQDVIEAMNLIVRMSQECKESEPFKDVFKRVRNRAGKKIRQETVADFVGVSKATISRWEQGEILPSYFGQLASLRETLSCSEQDFAALTVSFICDSLKKMGGMI